MTSGTRWGSASAALGAGYSLQGLSSSLPTLQPDCGEDGGDAPHMFRHRLIVAPAPTSGIAHVTMGLSHGGGDLSTQ
jgi:hypothetical protein